jgi:hypothetical protein
MLRAISADIVHAADPRHLARRPPAADPFELRDPEYIARTLPALSRHGRRLVPSRGARAGEHPGRPTPAHPARTPRRRVLPSTRQPGLIRRAVGRAIYFASPDLRSDLPAPSMTFRMKSY